jgi:hypothetical protein
MSPVAGVLLVTILAAVVAAGLVIALRLSAARQGQAPREPSLYVHMVAPRGDLPEPPAEFRWAPVPGADRYTVRISDADAVWPTFVRKTTGTSTSLTDKEGAALTPGRIHVWEVEAFDARGNLIATGAVQFRVRPPGAV